MGWNKKKIRKSNTIAVSSRYDDEKQRVQAWDREIKEMQSRPGEDAFGI